MKRSLLSLFFVAVLTCNFASAETSKTKDTNKAMPDDEFMKQFIVLEQKEKSAETRMLKIQKKSEETKKLRKTVDELGKQVGVD